MQKLGMWKSELRKVLQVRCTLNLNETSWAKRRAAEMELVVVHLHVSSSQKQPPEVGRVRNAFMYDGPLIFERLSECSWGATSEGFDAKGLQGHRSYRIAEHSTRRSARASRAR